LFEHPKVIRDKIINVSKIFIQLLVTALAKKRAGFGTRICLPSTEFCYVF